MCRCQILSLPRNERCEESSNWGDRLDSCGIRCPPWWILDSSFDRVLPEFPLIESLALFRSTLYFRDSRALRCRIRVLLFSTVRHDRDAIDRGFASCNRNLLLLDC